jgi:hypothetical protein
VDLDHVFDHPDGKKLLWVMDQLHTYTEVSVSGGGLHCIARGTIERNMGSGGGDTPHIEMYSTGRYFIFTGNIYNDRSRIEHRQEELERVFKTFKKGEQTERQTHPTHPMWDGDINSLPIKPETKNLIITGKPMGERSESIMTVLNALVWSNLTDTEIFSIFEQYPVGEKYREKKGNRQRWLQPQIAKAGTMVTDRFSSNRNGRSENKSDDLSDVDPIDIFGEPLLTGIPPFTNNFCPDLIFDYAVDTAERIGVTTEVVAIPAIVVCAAASHDGFMVHPILVDSVIRPSDSPDFGILRAGVGRDELVKLGRLHEM